MIRDKALLEKNDDAGAKARAEFLQMTRYDVGLTQRLTAIRNDVTDFPEESYGELALLCDIHGSDKGSLTDDPKQHPYAPLPAHTYADVYETLFRRNGFKDRVKAVFECGIGTTIQP
jgi:hypothetical protein